MLSHILTFIAGAASVMMFILFMFWYVKYKSPMPKTDYEEEDFYQARPNRRGAPGHYREGS